MIYFIIYITHDDDRTDRDSVSIFFKKKEWPVLTEKTNEDGELNIQKSLKMSLLRNGISGVDYI